MPCAAILRSKGFTRTKRTEYPQVAKRRRRNRVRSRFDNSAVIPNPKVFGVRDLTLVLAIPIHVCVINQLNHKPFQLQFPECSSKIRYNVAGQK